jgi:hypothetical protein
VLSAGSSDEIVFVDDLPVSVQLATLSDCLLLVDCTRVARVHGNVIPLIGQAHARFHVFSSSC